MEYKQRMVDSLLQDNLDAFGAVLVEGPKWCGKKTFTAGVHQSEARQQCA